MNKKIPHKDFIHYIPHAEGMQVNVNHENCTAGVDIKRRLYVKKVYGGALAYCHHCSRHGVLFNEEGKKDLSKWLKSESPDPLTTRQAASSFFTIRDEKNDFTFESKFWLTKYPFINEIVSENIIVADDHGRPVLPIYGFDQNIIGHQIRNVKGVPKYITTYYTSKGSGSWLRENKDKILYIVEDIISAFVLTRYTKESILALLGTNLNKEDEQHIKYYGYKCVVWLDEDDAGRKGAIKIVDRLKYLGLKCEDISHKQPKDSNVYEINAIHERMTSGF
jgi:hypothetical protein